MKAQSRLRGCAVWSGPSFAAYAQKTFFFPPWYVSFLQLREQGFRHIDAIDVSEDMLEFARKEGLYENYFVEYLTENELPIPPGKTKKKQKQTKKKNNNNNNNNNTHITMCVDL